MKSCIIVKERRMSKKGGGEDTKPVIKICDRRTEGRNITRSDWGNSISIIRLFVCFTFR